MNGVQKVETTNIYAGSQTIYIGSKNIGSIYPSFIVRDSLQQASAGDSEDGTVTPYINTAYINFDGVDNYIDLGAQAGLSDILDWTKDWTVAFILPFGTF